MVLSGTLRLSEDGTQRTVGRFNELVAENRAVFSAYFGVDLFPGSLNVDVLEPESLHRDLDAGNPPPAFVIPRAELINMPGALPQELIAGQEHGVLVPRRRDDTKAVVPGQTAALRLDRQGFGHGIRRQLTTMIRYWTIPCASDGRHDQHPSGRIAPKLGLKQGEAGCGEAADAW